MPPSTHPDIVRNGWARSPKPACAVERSSSTNSLTGCNLPQAVRRDLLAESRKHSATKLLRQVPAIGALRAALLVELIQTPYRFRTKRQLWAYSGLAIETHSSGNYRYQEGQRRRSPKPVALRGFNRNHNHDLKWIFKSASV